MMSNNQNVLMPVPANMVEDLQNYMSKYQNVYMQVPANMVEDLQNYMKEMQEEEIEREEFISKLYSELTDGNEDIDQPDTEPCDISEQPEWWKQLSDEHKLIVLDEQLEDYWSGVDSRKHEEHLRKCDEKLIEYYTVTVCSGCERSNCIRQLYQCTACGNTFFTNEGAPPPTPPALCSACKGKVCCPAYLKTEKKNWFIFNAMDKPDNVPTLLPCKN